MRRIDWSSLRRYVLMTGIAAITAVLVCGCGDGGGTTVAASYNTGAVAFNVVWGGDTEGDSDMDGRALSTCEAVTYVTAEIFSSGGVFIKGGSWLCEVRHGSIEKVPVGSNYMLVIKGTDRYDGIVYYGEKTGVDVVSGETTYVDDIQADSFIPALMSPANGAEISEGNVTLRWEKVDGATDYYVAVCEDESFNANINDTTTINNYHTLTSLEAGRTYYWYVAAGDFREEMSVDSEHWQFTTSADYSGGPVTPAALSVPENFYAVPDDGEMKLSWNPVEGATGYRLYYRTENDPDTIQDISADNSDVIVLPAAETLYFHQGLANGVIYSYAVTAYSGEAESDFSDQLSKIPAWGNNYQPDRWEGEWVSTFLGAAPVVSGSDGDWYRIEFDENNVQLSIECSFAHQDGDIDMVLYNVYGYEEAQAFSEDDNELIVYAAVEAGLYYIQIYTTPGTSNQYDLRWRTAPR